MEWIDLAECTDWWDVRLWTGSSWLSVRTGGMCSYGLDRAGLGYEQEGCAVMDWIELAQNKDRWDERLWTGSSWLRITTGGMCGHGMDLVGSEYGQVAGTCECGNEHSGYIN